MDLPGSAEGKRKLVERTTAAHRQAEHKSRCATAKRCISGAARATSFSEYGTSPCTRTISGGDLFAGRAWGQCACLRTPHVSSIHGRSPQRAPERHKFIGQVKCGRAPP